MNSYLLSRSMLRSCTRHTDKWVQARRQRTAVGLAAALLVGVMGGCSGSGGGAAGGNNGGGDTPAGAPTWAKSYGGPARDQAAAGMQRPGGGYVFVGSVNNRGSGFSRYSGLFEPGYESDLWVTTLDEYGDIEWQRSYGRVSTVPTDAPAVAFRGGVSYQRVRAAVDSESDGQRNGVWLAGYVNLRELDPEFQSTRYVEHGTDLIVTRLDADNQVVFSRSYDSGAFPLPYSFTDEQTSEATGSLDIWPTGDGGLLAAADATAAVRANGSTTLHGGIFVLKINAAGELQWSMLFRPEGAFGTRSELLVRELQGGAVLAYDLGSGMQIVRVDAGADTGSIRWRRTYENDERPADLMTVDDNEDGSIDALRLGAPT